MPAPAAAAPADDLGAHFAGLPRARSRTGRYELALTALVQVPHGADSVAIEVQAQLTSQHPDVLLDRVDKPVRRLVMNDGTELSYPEQLVTSWPARGVLAAGGMDVFHEHRGVWDLVLDATIVEVLAWQEYVAHLDGPGAHEGLVMGPFDVGVDARSDGVSLGFASTAGRLPAWEATLTQPRLGLVNHRFAAHAVELTDADGVRLESLGGGGSGGATVANFAAGRIAYPLRVRLRLPVRYRLEISSFRWQDLPLAPLAR